MKKFFKDLRGVFLSLKTTIFLLFVIAMVSIIGTLIPQQKDVSLYVAQFGEAFYYLFDLLGFFNIYGVWWFQLFLFLLMVNLIACSLNRLPKIWKRKYPSKKDWIGGLGPHLTHFSLIVILSGSLIGNIWGFKGHINIPQGESVDVVILKDSEKMLNLDFNIRCDKFEVAYYPGTQTPKEYLSKLVILKNGSAVLSKTIRVNDPLHYKGISFYQSSYGFTTPRPGERKAELEIIPKGNGSSGYHLRIAEGETKQIPGTDDKVQLAIFIPDFSLTDGNRVISRSDQPNNPAIQVNIYRSGKLLFNGWAFLKFPDFHDSKDTSYKVKFVNYYSGEKPYTGIMVVKDPGVYVVWTGFGILVLGLYLSFHIRKRSTRFQEQKDEGGTND